ncbi:unnamed protein product [Schistosoma intercalatum]|nr:unnamed protein product [Schistosoma intercalatum]
MENILSTIIMLLNTHKFANLSTFPFTSPNQSISSHDFFIFAVLITDIGVWVTHPNGQVISSTIHNDRLQSLVKLISIVIITLIGGCVTLDRIQCDSLLLLRSDQFIHHSV